MDYDHLSESIFRAFSAASDLANFEFQAKTLFIKNKHPDMEQIIIRCLLQGFNQKEIAQRLTELEMKPNSLSAIEKIIKRLKREYGAKTMFHLGAKIAKSKAV